MTGRPSGINSHRILRDPAAGLKQGEDRGGRGLAGVKGEGGDCSPGGESEPDLWPLSAARKKKNKGGD